MRGDTISAAAARDALAQGSLEPPRTARPSGGSVGWGDLANQAVAAFSEDMDKAAPETWDDVKAYFEKYLKPLVSAHLSGAARDPDAAKDVRALADAVESDRGTAQKQVERYLERFRVG